MAYPASLTTKEVSFGVATIIESGQTLPMKVIIKASRSLTHRPTGTPLVSVSTQFTSEPGSQRMLTLPVCDSPDMGDAMGRPIAVGPGEVTHTYTAVIDYLDGENGRTLPGLQRTVGPFVLLSSSPSPVDLDVLLVDGTPVQGQSIGIPDQWTTLVEEARAAADAAAIALQDSEQFLGDELAREDSPARDALDAALATATAGLKYRTDSGGDTIASALDTHTGVVKVALMSDSTGGNPYRWPSISMTAISARWPDTYVGYHEWNHDTQAYGARQVFNAGTGFIPDTTGGLVTALSDNFNRTAADVIGTNPQTGSAWTPSASLANGNWGLNGTKLVRLASAAVGVIYSDLGVKGDTTVTVSGVTMSTLPDTANREFNVWVRSQTGSTVNGLRCRLQVSTGTGAVAYHLFMQQGATAVVLATGAANPIPANTASTTFNTTLTTVGRDVTCVVNGVTLNHTLTEEHEAMLTGTAVGFNSSTGSLVGTSIDSITATVNQPATAAKGHGFLFWNGIRAGSTLAYQTERLEAMLPADADVIVISSIHNYALMATAPYIAEVEAFVALAKARAPKAQVVVSSQNPEFAFGSWTQAHVDAHAARNRALRVKAREEGWGYIPAFEAFLSVPNWETALMLPDGIHPNSSVQDPALNGNFVWRDTFLNYLEAHSLVTTS